jgi:uncharacterized protein with HEPN domain
MNESDRIRLRHMLDAAREAVSFAESQTRQSLDTNRMLALAEVRLLEIIGEAARSVSQEVKDRYSEVMWKQIVGARYRLIHGYYQVDLNVVWEIITVDLPPLIQVLENALTSDIS